MILMNNYSIKISRRAREDIIDIGDYIAYVLMEPETSKKLIKGLKNSISNLKYFTYRFPLIQNIRNKDGIRCMPYKNYFIFYIISEDYYSIIILRIGYKRRNWKDILI